MLITVIATGFGTTEENEADTMRKDAPAPAQQPQQPAAPANNGGFISRSSKPRNDGTSIFTPMNSNGTSDFRSTEFGRSFVSVFESAQQQAAANSAEAAAPAAAPIPETPAIPQPHTAAQSIDVIETPAKKTSSIFDDPDEDESDVLPIFKGRNIFSND